MASTFANHGGHCLVTKSCLTLATPWTVALQALLSMGCSRQEYWSGLPFPSPDDLANPMSEPKAPELQVVSGIAGRFFTDCTTKEAHSGCMDIQIHESTQSFK